MSAESGELAPAAKKVVRKIYDRVRLNREVDHLKEMYEQFKGDLEELLEDGSVLSRRS